MTRLAVVIGAHELYLAQGRLKSLGSSPGIARLLPADASKHRPDVIGLICVEPLLHGPSRDAQRTLPRGRLDRLEVQPVDRARSYERCDLGDDLRVERLLEPLFLTTSLAAVDAVSLASHIPSLTSTSSLMSRRKRRHSAICA